MRILHVINNLGLGGAETLLYRLVTRDRSNKHVVVSLGPAEWYSQRLEEAGIELHHLDMNSLGAVPGGLLQLNNILRESDTDVVQCWLYRSNLLGGMLGRAAGKPVAWSIHCSSLGPLKQSSRALVYLSGFLARWIPDFIVNCSSRSEELHAKLGFSKARGRVVHNGYDSAAFYPDDAARLAAREVLGIAPEHFAIGTVARWHPQKDIPNLLAAARLVRDRGIPVTCLLIGSGLGRDNIELAKEVRNAGSEDFALPLGERSDIQKIARALDLHVLASCGSEAFPNAVAETMLSGTPNSVTDIGDSALMVGKSGWVVPPHDPRRLADAIEAAYLEWKDKPVHWQKRRKAARKQIADNFTLDRMAEAYEALWEELVAARRS